MDLGLGQVAVLALVGGVAGFINVLAGGGSLLALPTLIFLGLDGSVANGTNRVALLVQNAVSVVSFFRKGYSHLKLSLTLTLCALPGAVIGALMGTRFEGIWFNRTLACIMIVLMVVMARGKVGQTATANQAVSRARLLTVHAAMLLVGFYGGFIQAGVGFMIIAILHRGLRLDLVHVNMHKVFIVGI
ncbi:MAG: sulfite exporter TauE/SafE family protein, partial [Verrucomicrobia bacterium]|nr:sulfite exporter TauE/SafE family protein [Verrucomicrobiota bacterium]